MTAIFATGPRQTGKPTTRSHRNSASPIRFRWPNSSGSGSLWVFHCGQYYQGSIKGRGLRVQPPNEWITIIKMFKNTTKSKETHPPGSLFPHIYFVLARSLNFVFNSCNYRLEQFAIRNISKIRNGDGFGALKLDAFLEFYSKNRFIWSAEPGKLP